MSEEWMDEVRALHARMDAQVDDWKRSYRGPIHCGRGCSNCCALAVEATFPEALVAAHSLSAGQGKLLGPWVERLRRNLPGPADLKDYLRQYRQTMEGCPFLEGDGACGIYPVRPLACRALLSTRNSAWCGTDTGALHPLERKAFLSGLDAAVVSWPTHYAAAPQRAGRELEAEISLRLARRRGFTLAGNFPYLVWLIRERDLAGAVMQGKDAVRELLAGEGGSPFLARTGI